MRRPDDLQDSGRRKVKPYPNVVSESIGTTVTQLRRFSWMRHLKTLAIAYLVFFGALTALALLLVLLR